MRFTGQIAGLGTTSGVRVVIGIWSDTPYGPFADVMVEQPNGHRLLLAPTEQIAEVITGLYTFDEVVVGAVSVSWSGSWCTVLAPGLSLQLSRGERTALGRLLRLVPAGIATAPGYLRVIGVLARVVMPSVRTFGRARDGRRMCYGALDVRGIERAHGTWRQRALGQLAPVDPPVRFGFGSTPAKPSFTRVVTTVLSDPDQARRPSVLRTSPGSPSSP